MPFNYTEVLEQLGNYDLDKETKGLIERYLFCRSVWDSDIPDKSEIDEIVKSASEKPEYLKILSRNYEAFKAIESKFPHYVLVFDDSGDEGFTFDLDPDPEAYGCDLL